MRGEPVFACPKVKPGAKLKQVEKAERAIAKEKTERVAKDEAKIRDGKKCRWPHKPGERAVCQRIRKESAHFKGKGAGGSNEVSNLVTFCIDVHQGPKSLHSGHRRVVPLTDKVMSGALVFEERETVGPDVPFVEVGREVSVGVLLRKKGPAK